MAKKHSKLPGLRGWDGERPSYPDLTKDDVRPRLQEALKRYQAETEQPADIGYSTAAVMLAFCEHVFDGKPIEDWMLNELAGCLYCVLMGSPWEEQFVLPKRSARQDFSSLHPLDLRDMRFVGRVTTLVEEESTGVEAAIRQVAGEEHVSFETARAGYYRMKKLLSGE